MITAVSTPGSTTTVTSSGGGTCAGFRAGPSEPRSIKLESPRGKDAGSAPFPVPDSSPGSGSLQKPDCHERVPPRKRRSPIACKRCRRLRSKCLHDKAKPPCKACIEAGQPEARACMFPVRGQSDTDRAFRHPRRSKKDEGQVVLPTPRRLPPSSYDPYSWTDLPSLTYLVDGVNNFTRHYFQLGFIPKQKFPELLSRNHTKVNLFLLFSILSISARLTPALRTYYGSGIKAAEYFMDRASAIALTEIYKEPNLERCQAFYLLSIAQQGSGIGNKSFINIGISMRMAALMNLHREETYDLPGSTPDVVIQAESARRTLWMLHSQDSLHSGPANPVTLAASEITALLPCSEEDFASGREPASRAALEGTPPAIECPSLTRDPRRSLFASLMQIHHFWGIVGRRAVKFGRSPRPWEKSSDFSRMVSKLEDWEASLPPRHRWSIENLRYHKARAEDLAYLSVTMVTRLCNIVIRRPYLIDILNIHNKNTHDNVFFSALATELFNNVSHLFEQIDAQFTGRSPDEGVGAQMAAFCIYSCGLFSAYLCKHPHLCQDPIIASRGPFMLNRTTSILMECKEVWPVATQWATALENFTHNPQSATLANPGTMADSKEPVPDALSPVLKPDSPSRARHHIYPSTPKPELAPIGHTLEHDVQSSDHQPSTAEPLPPLLEYTSRVTQYEHASSAYQPASAGLYIQTGGYPATMPEQQSEGLQTYVPNVTTYGWQQNYTYGAKPDQYQETQPMTTPMAYNVASTVSFDEQLLSLSAGFDSELQLYFDSLDGLYGWVPTMSDGWSFEPDGQAQSQG